jgi:hypothetical protein
MKRAFMIGVAAGALLAGVNIAAAQGTMERQQPGAAGEQKSGSGAQQQQKGSGGAEKQDAQKQGDQKQDAQKQGDRQKQDAQKQGDQKQDAQKQGDQKQDAQKQGDRQKQDAQKQGDQKQDAQKQGDQQKTQGAQKPDQKQDAQKQDAQKSGGGGQVTLSSEQKTKVRETVIRSGNAPRVTNVNFSVNVGTVIPRETRLAPLPPILVEIYPQWRSYRYVIVEERIIIIEPDSFKIVAIVEV